MGTAGRKRLLLSLRLACAAAVFLDACLLARSLRRSDEIGYVLTPRPDGAPRSLSVRADRGVLFAYWEAWRVDPPGRWERFPARWGRPADRGWRYREWRAAGLTLPDEVPWLWPSAIPLPAGPLVTQIYPVRRVEVWASPGRSFLVAVPMWNVAAVLAAPWAVAAARWCRIGQRRRRAVAGRCPACGYDLRASPDRCPECGAEPVARPAE